MTTTAHDPDPAGDSDGHAVILGAGPGLGAAYARRFLADGAHVTLMSRSPTDLAGTLHATPGRLRTRAVDLTDDAALVAALTELDADRPITALVYNAVGVHRAPISTLTIEEIRSELAVGIEAAWLAIATVLPAMRSRGHGAILVTGGGAGIDALPGAGFLSPTKAALRLMVLALAADLADTPIEVGTVTVAGRVDPIAGIDPDRVADELIALMKPGSPTETVIS